MAEQLTLALSAKEALGREDFFVSEANALAVAAIEAPETWPLGKMMIIGPAASGKTHLAHVWAASTGAPIVTHTELAGADIGQHAQGPLVVEDVQPAGLEAETALFHLHNEIQAAGYPLLMTSQAAPAVQGFVLADLLSRLQGTSTVELSPPDDALLSVVLVKLFADRQLQIDAKLLDYVLPRIERSFAAARDFVEQLDRRALAEGKKPGMRLARDVLGVG